MGATLGCSTLGTRGGSIRGVMAATLLLLGHIGAAGAGEVSVGLLDSMIRHNAYEQPQEGVGGWGGGADVVIAAAGRERESAQVLLRSRSNTTAQVRLAAPTTLPAGSLRVQRLGFVWATNATDPVRTWPMPCPADVLAEQGGCWVADPLLPLLPNSSVFLPAGLTVALWVTFVAPTDPDLLDSTHSASLAIEGAEQTIRFELRIRAFALPLAPALKNTVQLDIAHLHRCFPSATEEDTYRTYQDYALFALRELRLNPGSIYDGWRKPGPAPCRFTDYQSCFNTSAAQLAKWVREEGLNAFTIPSGPQNQTQPFVEELRKHNISHLASFYSFDGELERFVENRGLPVLKHGVWNHRVQWPVLSDRERVRPAQEAVSRGHNAHDGAHRRAVRRPRQGAAAIYGGGTAQPVDRRCDAADELPPAEAQHHRGAGGRAAGLDVHLCSAVQALAGLAPGQPTHRCASNFLDD